MRESKDQRPVILAVDDNPDNLGVLFELLTEQGFRLLVAEDGESALRQAEYVHPGLILLDIMLPDMDGFAVCKALKEQPSTRDIPVLFMSALTDTRDKVTGLRAGAVDYITKPFQHEEVLARVRTHLALEELRGRLRENEERLGSILESAMDAIVTLDQEGRVTLFNQAAERVFRRDAERVVGRLFTPFASERLRRLLTDYQRQKTEPQPPLWLPEGCTAVRANGELFPIEASLSRSRAGGQTLYTLILRDVHERQQAEAEQRRLQGINRYLAQELSSAQGATDLIGAAKGLRAVMEQVRQVAATDATVLITGETGTGKELIARAVHAQSPRRDQTLVTLNCAAIPEGLVESELFGHEKGAFTGALARKIGRFELADRGTLFLDEIGELSVDLQAKLLRILQEGEFERLGSPRTLKVNVRIVAATNRDLAEQVASGAFRADLYYRLNVFPIPLPPLRERREDIPALVEHFVGRYAGKYGKNVERVSEAVMESLKQYDWPGNVRELEHLVERAVILSTGPELMLDQPLQAASARPQTSGTGTLQDVERSHILQVLEESLWRVSGPGGAAERLGLKPSTLESRMKKLGIVRPNP